MITLPSVSSKTSNNFKKVGSSINIDKRLYKEDIRGSMVHTDMLCKQKIISLKVKEKILWGLNRIKNEIDKKKFRNLPNVSKIIDNKIKTESNSYIHSKDNLTDKYRFPNFNNLITTRTRATLQIQQGCDHRCTFCIIPFGRGDAVSLPLGDVNKRLRNIISLGYKEVTFTGIDLTSYGSDLPGKPSLGN